MICPKCGKENREGAAFCAGCGGALGAGVAHHAGAPVSASPAQSANHAQPVYHAHPTQPANPAQPAYHATSSAPGPHMTTVNVQAPVVQKNGIGTAGFVLALIALFTFWVPILGWILWILGAILSLVGVFRAPKGLAIAGLVISFIDVIVLLLGMAACSAIGVSAGF